MRFMNVAGGGAFTIADDTICTRKPFMLLLCSVLWLDHHMGINGVVHDVIAGGGATMTVEATSCGISNISFLPYSML